MDTLTYQISEADAIACESEFPLSKTNAANFSNNIRPAVTSYRRLLCMNVKQPNILRVLTRQGKYSDTTVKASAIRHLCSTESSSAHPSLFYAVGGKELAVLNPKSCASGELEVSSLEFSFDEELFASTPGDAGVILVLGQQHVLRVDEATGTVKSKIDLTPKTVVKYPTFDFNQKAQLLVVPAKTAQLDLVSTRTGKSVLSKSWEPHAGAAPTFAHFFQVHKFDDENVEENALIVTAARGNAELRFWAYNQSTQRFNLRQEISLTNTTDGEEFDISITPGEEYITLASRSRAYAVVIETHRHELKAHRITTWKTKGASLCCTAYVCKVAESQQSKSVRFELFLTMRTAEGYFQLILDTNKLIGASNLATLKTNSVASWFPDVAGAASDATGNSIGNTQLTAVSSSLRGDSKTTSAISEASAAKVVRQQAKKFCDQVRSLDSEFSAVQKSTSNTMRMLQEPKFREEAQSNGRRFAARNKGRLEGDNKGSNNNNQATEHGMMTQAQKELVIGINSFVKEVEGGSERAASTALKSLLSKQLKSAVQKASSDMEQLDVGGTAAMNIANTDATRQFRQAVDEATRQMLLSVRQFHGQMRTSLESSTKDTNASVERAKKYAEAMRRTTADLKRDLNEAKAAVEEMAMSGAAAAPVVDPEALVARAVALAEAGDWPAAVTTAIESSDITVLLAFLSSNVCEQNQSTLMAPKTLSIPLFLSLCLQLSFEMDSYPAEVPLRIRHLHLFYIDWDDALKSIKAQAQKDPRQAPTFDSVKRELTTVLEALCMVEVDKIDRKSRTNLRMLTKLMAALLSE